MKKINTNQTRDDLITDINWLLSQLNDKDVIRVWSLANRLFVTQTE